MAAVHLVAEDRFGSGQLEPGLHVMAKPFAMEVLASRLKELIGGPAAASRGP